MLPFGSILMDLWPMSLFFEPRSVEVSLKQTFYDSLPAHPWPPGCNIDEVPIAIDDGRGCRC